MPAVIGAMGAGCPSHLGGEVGAAEPSSGVCVRSATAARLRGHLSPFWVVGPLFSPSSIIRLPTWLEIAQLVFRARLVASVPTACGEGIAAGRSSSLTLCVDDRLERDRPKGRTPRVPSSPRAPGCGPPQPASSTVWMRSRTGLSSQRLLAVRISFLQPPRAVSTWARSASPSSRLDSRRPPWSQLPETWITSPSRSSATTSRRATSRMVARNCCSHALPPGSPLDQAPAMPTNSTRLE